MGCSSQILRVCSYILFIKTGHLCALKFEANQYEQFINCLAKESNFTNIVQRSNSNAYLHLNFQWQLKPPHKAPLAYLLVRNSQDIVTIVRCGTKHHIHLVAKGGGHSQEKYSFGDSNSIVIDVRNLKKLKINKSKMTAEVGASWLIGPLAYTLSNRENVFIPLGICPTVGISGIATGGGIGFYARKHGLTVDNVLEVKIVTAKGVLVTANKDQNSDLFWALRGGVGSNFGIVVSFKFKIYSAPERLLYGKLEYKIAQFAEVLDAWQHFIPLAPNDVSAYFLIGNRKMQVLFTDLSGRFSNLENFINKFPESVQKSITTPKFSEHLFEAAQAFELLTPKAKFSSAPDFVNLTRESALPVYNKRKSFFVSRKVGPDGLALLKAFMEGMPDTLNLEFESFGGVINKVPSNETAFVHRSTLFNVFIQYRTPAPNATANAIGSFWVKKFFELGKILFSHTETYQNYVDGDLPNYLDRYYGSNLERLVQVKKKYDPKNYFCYPQSIPTEIYELTTRTCVHFARPQKKSIT